MQIGRPLIRVTEVGSTMELAASLALAGATSGTAVLAAFQSQGRGRAGRAWDAAPWSSILMSFLHFTNRSPESIGILPLLIGLATADTVAEFTGGAVHVKWPNDVLIGELKVAGILMLNKAAPGRSGACLVTGIGLNVANQASELPATATSIALAIGSAPPPSEVLDSLFAQLTRTIEQFEQGDTSALQQRLGEHLAFKDEFMAVQDGSRRVEGYLRGFAPSGALMLETPTGTLVPIVAGDVTRGPRRIGPDRPNRASGSGSG